MSKVRIGLERDGCWEWNAHMNAEGYGRFQMGIRKCEAAHRISYQLFVGKISKGMIICHRCDNPSCVNPDHLFLGTNRINSDDKVRKKRHLFGIKVPLAKLNPDIVRQIRNEYEMSKTTYRKLSKKYKVCCSNIYYIVSHETWKSVA